MPGGATYGCGNCGRWFSSPGSHCPYCGVRFFGAEEYRGNPVGGAWWMGGLAVFSTLLCLAVGVGIAFYPPRVGAFVAFLGVAGGGAGAYFAFHFAWLGREERNLRKRARHGYAGMGIGCCGTVIALVLTLVAMFKAPHVFEEQRTAREQAAAAGEKAAPVVAPPKPPPKAAPLPVAPPPRRRLVPLFDGTDASRWALAAAPGWQVYRGSLVCTAPANLGDNPLAIPGLLVTHREYADYALRFDFYLAPKGQLYVAPRVRDGQTPWGVRLRDESGRLTDSGPLSGSLVVPLQPTPGGINTATPTPLARADPSYRVLPDTWHTAELRVVGRKVSMTVGAMRVTDADLAALTWEPGASRWVDQDALEVSHGRIGVRAFGGQVALRNVVLDPIRP